MSAVVFGAEAVRRGVDTLGVAPAAAWWLTGADPLAAMLEERARLQVGLGPCRARRPNRRAPPAQRTQRSMHSKTRRQDGWGPKAKRCVAQACGPAPPPPRLLLSLQAQVERQRAQLAAQLDPVEVRALGEQCAAAMRPPWALSLASFTQASAQRERAPPACGLQMLERMRRQAAEPGAVLHSPPRLRPGSPLQGARPPAADALPPASQPAMSAAPPLHGLAF
jgi:hypothetical protein